MIVVADSSPLIALLRVDRLDLLHELYGSILVPEAVWKELVEPGGPGAALVPQSDWILPRTATDRSLVQTLSDQLDLGECEAIALAQEVHADVLLMDETLGRAAAQQLGLKVTGLIGVLLDAKNAGVLPDAVALAEAMRSHGWWIGDRLIDCLR